MPNGVLRLTFCVSPIIGFQSEDGLPLQPPSSSLWALAFSPSFVSGAGGKPAAASPISHGSKGKRRHGRGGIGPASPPPACLVSLHWQLSSFQSSHSGQLVRQPGNN